MEYPDFDLYDFYIEPKYRDELKSFKTVITFDGDDGPFKYYLTDDNTIDLSEEVFDSWNRGEKKYYLIFESPIDKTTIAHFMTIEEFNIELSKLNPEELCVPLKPEDDELQINYTDDERLYYNGANSSPEELLKISDGWIIMYSYDREHHKFRFGFYLCEENLGCFSIGSPETGCIVNGKSISLKEQIGEEEYERIRERYERS